MSDHTSFPNYRGRRRPQRTNAQPTPIAPAHKPVGGIGTNTSRCYCPCGGKLKNGKCARGCDAQ